MAKPANPFTREIWAVIAKQFPLTKREGEVAWLVVHDVKREAIARQLRIARSTVNSHVRNVFKKSGVADRGQFIAEVTNLAWNLKTEGKA